MLTVTQVFKSDRLSIYCSVNVPFSKRSIEIDLALSNANANRSLFRSIQLEASVNTVLYYRFMEQTT